MCRIAVVDDDESVRRGLSRLLSLHGYAVSTFVSAEEFLRHVPESRFSCLVLDIYLGGMTGIDLGRELRKSGNATPIVYMTAHDEAETSDALASGPSAVCLRKPFTGAELISQIARLAG